MVEEVSDEAEVRQSSSSLLSVVAYRFISFWLVLLGGWVAFIALAYPLRRSRGR